MNPSHLHALGKSTAITTLFIGVITIYTELDEGFKAGLKTLAGHHWVAKGILSIFLFLALYYYFSKTKQTSYRPLEMVKIVIACTLLSGLAIFGFYLWELLKG